LNKLFLPNYIFAVAAIILFFTQSSFGAKKKMEINSMIRMQGNYQDNVFLSEENAEEGYFLNANPGIRFRYTGSRSKTDIEYQAHVKYYSYDIGEKGTFDSERYDIFHEGRLRLESRLRPSRQKSLVFKLNDRYCDSQTVSQFSNISQDSQNKYFINTLRPEVGLEFLKKIKLLGHYENEIVQFKSKSANHSIQHVYGLDVEYYKSRRNFFSLGYQQSQKDFDNTTDYAVKEGKFDFRRIFNRTWSGGFNFSYQMRDYVKNSGVKDWSGPAMIIYLRATRKKKLDLELTYQNKRSSFDSSFLYRIDRWDLKNKWKPTKKLSMDFSPFYQRDTYDFPPGRKDSLWGFKSQIALHPKNHISLGLGYDYANRDSNEKGFGYESNVYYLFFSVNEI
jgi:hypothetical protein